MKKKWNLFKEYLVGGKSGSEIFMNKCHVKHLLVRRKVFKNFTWLTDLASILLFDN